MSELMTVAIQVCPACFRGRGPLPLGGREMCRTPQCFFEEQTRPSSDAMPSRLVPMVTAAEIEQARQLGEDVAPKVLRLVEAAEKAREGLQFFGRHTAECAMRQPHWLPDEPPCTCGLEADITQLIEALKPWQPPPPRPMDELVERRALADHFEKHGQ